MSLKLQAAMTSELGSDETNPRRFDLTMSRRTRRPAAARQPELDAHQEHETSEQRSEDTKEHTLPPQKEEEEEEECQDNSRRFSLQELIEDEAVDGGVKDAATGGTGENAARGVGEVAEGAAVAGEANRPGVQQVAGRKVIGMIRRYVKVRSIKTKRASPEKNATPVC